MEIMEVWVGSGLPAENKESVTIKSNGYVTISNLANHVCRLLIGNIYNKSHFDKKLFCNGIIPLTPEKKDTETFSSVKTSTTAVQCSLMIFVHLDSPHQPPLQPQLLHLLPLVEVHLVGLTDHVRPYKEKPLFLKLSHKFTQ